MVKAAPDWSGMRPVRSNCCSQLIREKGIIRQRNAMQLVNCNGTSYAESADVQTNKLSQATKNHTALYQPLDGEARQGELHFQIYLEQDTQHRDDKSKRTERWPFKRRLDSGNSTLFHS
jgi:hypothetical protein